MLALDTKVAELNRVGKILNARLKRLGIETVEDLIFYYPFRYDDFSQVLKVSELKAGLIATVRVKVKLLANRRSFRKRKILTEGLVGDESDEIKVIWFNQPWIAKNLKVGDEIYLAGKVSGDLFDIYFNSPIYEKVSAFNVNTARLAPVYPLTEGISQKQLRFLVKSVIGAAGQIKDFLPAPIVKQENFLSLPEAIRQIHFPKNNKSLFLAKKRLSFDELFLIQLWSQIIRKNLKNQSALKIEFKEQETRRLISRLTFDLTADQKKAAWEILKDLAKAKPMNRLLQGDVGSGKTLVAAIAIYNIALNGFQSALMAPTEILARQHFETFKELFKNSKIKIGLLTRSQRFLGEAKLSKNEFLEECQKGGLALIIGTHAVIQDEVKFKNLALVVIDEQHRFGVKQREALKEKSKNKYSVAPTPPASSGRFAPELASPPRAGGEVNVVAPHLLSLTATPIPRSLALTIYGDLDVSTIKEMPKDRKKILTKIVSPEKRQLAYNFISEEIKKGRQVFVICPLIDPSDKLGVRSVTQEFEKLDQQVFPRLPVGLIHGRLKPAEKEKVMTDFIQNKISILVATAVVEVGVDIPNATVMMIEGAERFGLAQLHQFRGRVGRSEHQSYCFLFSDSGDLETIKRLELLVISHDGFALAQKDLDLRGAGNLYGHEQSGFNNLKIADLSDLDLIQKTRLTAIDFLVKNNLEDFPLLAEKIASLGLAEHLE